MLHSVKDLSQLELIQRRAARWVCGSRWISVNRSWTKSSDSCLQELNWSPLHTRRSYFSISLTHDILHNRVAIPFSRYFQFSTTIIRSHPMTLCIPSSTINPYCYSFFVNTPFLWNTIPLRILQLSNPIVFWTALCHFLCNYIKICSICCNCLCFVCIFVCFVWGALLQAMPSVYPRLLTKLII